MGLNRVLARAATARPRVHLVEAPGGSPVRWAVEDALEARGWRRTPSPAAADALVVAGRLPDDLRDAADLLWSQLPGPRVRRHVEALAEVDGALDTLPAALRERAAHRDDARERGGDEVSRFLPDDAEDGHMSPGGVPLAEGAEDRDGLEMDVLHVRLGPILPRWPGGFVLCCELHGDVIVVGSRGLSGTDAVLGSVSDLVVHYATVPVLVVPNPLLITEFEALREGPVVVGYDGSDGAEKALDSARRLFPGRRLLLAAVRDGDEDVPVGPAARDAELLSLRMPKLAGPASRVAADLLVECADQHDAAVLVVGSRGRSTIREVLLGSVARGAVHRTHRPVLVVHG